MNIGWQILTNGFIAGSLYALIAMGFNLVYGVQTFFHLAHGITAVTAGYFFFALLSHTTWPAWLCILIALIGAGMTGILMERAVFCPIRRHHGKSLTLMTASFGLIFLGQALLSLVFSSEYQSCPRALWQGTFALGSVVVTYTQGALFFTALLAFMLIKLFLRCTSYGRTIRAVSDDIQVATLIGIRTERVITIVFFLASFCAGLAGIFTCLDIGLQPNMGLSLLLKGAAASVIGGLGTLEGAFVGAFFLGIVENLGIWHIPSEWKDSIAFGLLIVFLLIRPAGLLKRRI